MLYLDTSLVVSAISREATTARVQRWLEDQDQTLLTVSDWTITEVSSALAQKIRTRDISVETRAEILSVFNRLLAETFTLLAVKAPHFRVAAKFTDQHALGLRSGDALHLAIASDHGATLYTLDGRLAEAGPLVGVPTVLVD